MITVQINLQFTVTVCEADSTTCTESDSTVSYEESDSDNDSLSSQPMFMEIAHKQMCLINNIIKIKKFV